MIFVFLILLPGVLGIKHFASKTPYDYIRGDITEVEWNSTLVPTGIYLVIRHGSREFSNHTYGMTEMADKLEGSLSWMTDDWVHPEYTAESSLLPQGMLELFHLGQRFRQRFGETLFPRYYPWVYDLRTTSEERTIQSAMSFMAGLLGKTGPLNNDSTRENMSWTGYQPVSINLIDDELLLPYEYCPEYNMQIKEMNAANDLIIASEEFQAYLEEMSLVLGWNVTAEDIENLYFLCVFEHVSPTNANFSQYCDIMPEGLQHISAAIDANGRVYQHSYLNPWSPGLSKVIIEDLITGLSTNPSIPYLRFARSETFIALITLLDLYRDAEDKYWMDRENNILNISNTDSFASNLAFVMFENVESNESVIKVGKVLQRGSKGDG